MFCSKCGAEIPEGAAYCSSCGAAVGAPQQGAPSQPSQSPQPSSVTVQVDPSVTGPHGTPGTGALWLSIFGFVCGIPAILGIIFGIGARREAKQRGKSPAKANWAIFIGLLWLLPAAFIFVVGFLGLRPPPPGEEPRSSETTSRSEQVESEPQNAIDAPDEDRVELSKLRFNLQQSGFTCSEPDGALELIQCEKGRVNDPEYGSTPIQLVNIELGTGDVHGYAKPKTLETIEEYVTVDDFGPDGSGTGSRMFG